MVLESNHACMSSFQTNIPTITFNNNNHKSKDRVVINVGGSKHECYISTIQNFPDTRLYWIAETALKMADFDPDANEFFFDRHPGCFENIMNYCRTGKLHCPNDVCGPLFEQELAFWGVDELMMEPCCWGSYTQHRDAHKNLKMFDTALEEGDELDEEEREKRQFLYKNMSCWEKFIMTVRPTIWAALEKPFSSGYAQIVAVISMFVIIVSIATFCLQTMPYFDEYKNFFEILEYIYCAIFTFELLIRVACCPSYKAFFTNPLTYIDLISTLQFYIAFFVKTNALDFLFVSRLIRIFRLFRFFKQLSGMQVIAQTLKASMNELMLLMLIVMIPMIIFSTLIYYAEQKNTKKNFRSIPESFWWAIITMTTVGYGDVVPMSGPAKIIGAMCACSGVLIVALPVSVIGSNFTLYYSYAQARMKLPQRRSPALVSADKALVHNNNNKQADIESLIDTSSRPKSPKSPSRRKKPARSNSNQSKAEGLMVKSMQESAAVMLDVVVPIRERRHAIQPAINPIRKSLKRNGKTLSTALATTLDMSMNAIPQEDTTSDFDEANEDVDCNECCTAESMSSFATNADSTQSLNSIAQSENSINFSMTCKSIGHAGHAGKPLRVIHADISSYVPAKMSPAQIKARRKMSEVPQVHNLLPEHNSALTARKQSVFKLKKLSEPNIIYTRNARNSRYRSYSSVSSEKPSEVAITRFSGEPRQHAEVTERLLSTQPI